MLLKELSPPINKYPTNQSDAKPKRVEGYWGVSEEDKQYPWPKAGVEPWDEQDNFLKNLYKVQDTMEPKGYRGWSNCRICGMKNGSQEYEDDNWIWPAGYAHYIELHNVKPTEDFAQYIKDKAIPV